MLTLALLIACSTPAPTPAPPASRPEPAAAPAPPPPEPEPEPEPEVVDLTVPSDEEALVERLADVEARLRDPSTPAETALDLAHLQQRIYRALAGDAPLRERVVAALPARWREVAQRNADATAQIARTVRKPRTDLPAWRIVPPPPAEELVEMYRAAEAEHGVDWEVLAAIHLCETRMGRLRGVSYAGARGPMQFMPATWDAYGKGDIESPADAIWAAGNYLAKMGFAKDPRKAVWHYNHHDGYVNSVLTFASVMADDPLAYRGYHGWRVYYRTVAGDLWLKEGYESQERGPIDAYCAEVGAPACPQAPPP